jgi:hypothetical protein
MKLFKIHFDATRIALYAKNVNDAILLLKGKDKNFFIENGELKYKWVDDFSEVVTIYEQEQERGIISWEAH